MSEVKCWILYHWCLISGKKKFVHTCGFNYNNLKIRQKTSNRKWCPALWDKLISLVYFSELLGDYGIHFSQINSKWFYVRLRFLHSQNDFLKSWLSKVKLVRRRAYRNTTIGANGIKLEWSEKVKTHSRHLLCSCSMKFSVMRSKLEKS